MKNTNCSTTTGVVGPEEGAVGPPPEGREGIQVQRGWRHHCQCARSAHCQDSRRPGSGLVETGSDAEEALRLLPSVGGTTRDAGGVLRAIKSDEIRRGQPHLCPSYQPQRGGLQPLYQGIYSRRLILNILR